MQSIFFVSENMFLKYEFNHFYYISQKSEDNGP